MTNRADIKRQAFKTQQNLDVIREMIPDCRTIAELGGKLGVSRERARQLVREAGFLEWRSKPRIEVRLCAVCGNLFKPRWNKIQTCSTECANKLKSMKHVKAPRLTLVCEMCGMVFIRKASRVKPTSPGRFCSARCRSKWLKKRG